ncbi:MAG: cache and HAMP domain-containing protein, partial [Chloroflexota bacterium]
MSFDLWGINGIPFVGLPGHLAGYAVLGLYALLLFIAAAPVLAGFLKLKPAQWLLLATLLLAAPILITALKIRFPGTVAPPGVPDEPVGPTLSLLGYTPIILAAGFLGSGPAILVGLAAGLARAGWETFEITTAFEMALAAALFSWMIRQSYRGWLPRVIRIPLIASTVTAATIWLLSFLSYLANSTALGLSGIDFITAEWVNGALPLSGELLIGGAIGTLGLIAFPAAWAPRAGRLPPPYASSLNNRLLFTFLPLSFVSLLFLIWASSRIAIQVSTSLIVDQMGNDAKNAANTVPYFDQTGRSILNSLAADPHLQDPSPPELEPWLADQIRSIAFFRHLAFLNLAGDVIGAYPPGEGPAKELTPEEETALGLDFPQTITVYPRDPLTGATQIQVSFIVPVFNQSGAQIGALIGRADIENNPLLKPAIDQLDGLTANGGQGFILDDRNNIIYHPDQTRLLELWLPADQPDETFTTTIPEGTAYRDRAPGNTRQLVYTLPVNGFPWSVVIVTRNEVVLTQATRIVGPFVALLSIIGVIGAGIVLWVTSRITLPLETLAKATASIAQGEFNRPVQIAGEDEVGRLGIAFERMRERLRARLEELNLLLRISQGIAGSLNLDQSLPDLLEGAITSTKSNGVRLIIRSRDDVPA